MKRTCPTSFDFVARCLHLSVATIKPRCREVGRSSSRFFSSARIIQFLPLLIGGFLFTPALQAQVKVFVDFTSDAHNGAGGAPNGTPDWVDELSKLTTATGVDPFTPMERTGIETAIMMELSAIYSGYDITFSTTTPTAPFDTINFGADSTGAPSPTALGIAPTDQANIASSQKADIFTANFKSILDEFSGSGMRPLQLSQIATALGGTGGHELGHTLGLDHHDAYSDPSITPATYAATGGVQNTYIMATGETGLSEPERETTRALSPWSKAKLDLTGGAIGHIAGDHQSLVTSPIPLDVSEESPGVDAGSTLGTAMPMTLSMGSKSGMLLGFAAGTPDGATPPVAMMDADMWKIALPSAGLLSAEVFSVERFGTFGYNTMLELFDSGGSPMFTVGDLFYDDDTFNAATFRQTDPAMINIPIVSAGFYFLKVSPTVFADVGTFDGYWLMAGFLPIPEPATSSLSCCALALLFRFRPRRCCLRP